MNSSLHPERRTTRANDLRRTYSNRDDVLYTDTAFYNGQAAMLVSVIDSDFDIVVTASIRTIQPVVAEENEIDQAIVFPPKADHVTILSDSQAAIRRFGEGESPRRTYGS
ncbi:hypothetical protein HPB47_014969 [Ixodes persulcatus]|uniref:Uncharacterized protein n=1 Tax=Ixodes persulcatus TaxID=34615 RepID=A0AC60QX82_IXOPE|nr:hypothetical protein HPB47_014969 [Ixodes persulcatus]